jgi:hypothetical protein
MDILIRNIKLVINVSALYLKETSAFCPGRVLGNCQVSAFSSPGVHSASNRNQYQGIPLG